MSDAKAAAAARRAKILARDKSRLDIAKGLKVTLICYYYIIITITAISTIFTTINITTNT